MDADELFAALSGHEITVRPDDDFMSVSGASALSPEARQTLVDWKQNKPERRAKLIQYLWMIGKPASDTPEDAARCPACPYRGQGAIYTFGGVPVVCDCKCKPGQEVKVTL